jgi:hypothetical protein
MKQATLGYQGDYLNGVGMSLFGPSRHFVAAR